MSEQPADDPIDDNPTRANPRKDRLPGLLTALGVGVILIAAGVIVRSGQGRAIAFSVAATQTALIPENTPQGSVTAPFTPTIPVTPTDSAPVATGTPLPTPVPASRASLDVGGYSTPSVAPPTAIPTPVEPVVSPDGATNILLMGSDRRPDDPGYRTDTMIVVSINTVDNTVNMLSIPRDLLVYVPGWTMRKINTAFAHGEAYGWPGGGGGLMKETLLYNFGISIDYYAFVELRAFEEIVDTMGTIEVPVDCAIEGFTLREPRMKQSDFATYEEWVDYTDPDENPQNYTRYTADIGVQEFDGYLSLWYARQRIGSSDFDRAFRQQQVLRAVLVRAQELGILNVTNIPEYWQQYNDLVQTDLGLGNLVQLAPVARELEEYTINSFVITPDLLEGWYNPDTEQQAFLLRPDAVQQFVTLAMQPPSQNYVIQNTASVEVRNGTDIPRLDEVAANRLQWNGLNAVATGPADSDQYEDTAIFDFTGREKTSQLRTIQRATRTGDDRVTVTPDPNRVYDYVVILGEDYSSCSRSINVPLATPVPDDDEDTDEGEEEDGVEETPTEEVPVETAIPEGDDFPAEQPTEGDAPTEETAVEEQQ